jgi:hypothetical protein
MRALAIDNSGDVHPRIAPLRSLVATARSRLAEIEAKYTADRCAVEATGAKLFTQVKQHYLERDQRRLIICDRREYLAVLLASGEREGAHVVGEHLRATPLFRHGGSYPAEMIAVRNFRQGRIDRRRIRRHSQVRRRKLKQAYDCLLPPRPAGPFDKARNPERMA